MTNLLPFQQLARLCLKSGIKNIIICPGSRNAALTIAFTSEKGLKCYSISDERSAAYIALGMSLQTSKTTAIICTSGTAALNFAPAIAEAYFQEIPLLVLTADRPPEWVHQYDGQTIFQDQLYGKHVKKAYTWPVEQKNSDIDFAAELSNQAISLTQNQPKGPVHINIPIREPFYPDVVEPLEKEWNIERYFDSKENPIHDFEDVLGKHSKRLLVIGQQNNADVKKQARSFAERFGFVLVADSIANTDDSIQNHDHFLKNLSQEEKRELIPDLLISTDMSLISKSLKLLLREGKIKEHWHIQNNPAFIDPFRSLTKKVEIEPFRFFNECSNYTPFSIDKAYSDSWLNRETQSISKINSFFGTQEYSEFHVLKSLLERMSADSIIHAGNSMSIRYINALQKYINQEIFVYCNRGTSGIDGSLSTAVGQAINTDKTVYCILGDLSFQYDKNALWNRYLPENLKIVVLNNAGGIIFSMIEGPRKQDSFDDFFRTHQPNKADLIAQEFGLNYLRINNKAEAELNITKFLTSKTKTVLEIFTDYNQNESSFKSFFKT